MCVCVCVYERERECIECSVFVGMIVSGGIYV